MQNSEANPTSAPAPEPASLMPATARFIRVTPGFGGYSGMPNGAIIDANRVAAAVRTGSGNVNLYVEGAFFEAFAGPWVVYHGPQADALWDWLCNRQGVLEFPSDPPQPEDGEESDGSNGDASEAPASPQGAPGAQATPGGPA